MNHLVMVLREYIESETINMSEVNLSHVDVDSLLFRNSSHDMEQGVLIGTQENREINIALNCQGIRKYLAFAGLSDCLKL
jgi:hypothetical protein